MSDDLPPGWATASIDELGIPSAESVNPANFTAERFALFSVPSFAVGSPESVLGNAIGSTKQRVQPGDVLLCKIVPHINRVWVVPPHHSDRQIASSEWIVIRNEHLDSHFLRYCLSGPSFRQEFLKDLTGIGGSLTRARPQTVRRIQVPIAPLHEQGRIVTKLDSSFTRTKVAHNELERVPLLIELYKRAILEKAFTGELTSDFRRSVRASSPADQRVDSRREKLSCELGCRFQSWRFDSDSNLHEMPASWTWNALGNLVVHRSGIMFKSTDFGDNGRQVIRLGNLYQGKLDLNRSPVFLAPSIEDYDTFLAKAGDILVSQTGTKYRRDYGHFVKLSNEQSGFLINQRVLCIAPIDKTYGEYMLHFSKSELFKSHFFSKETGGVNQGNVGIDGVMTAPIPMPPYDEMKEIVRRIEAATEWTAGLVREHERATRLLGHLDQALLAKAFRGELVPQDPNDEPAEELLSRIRDRVAAQPKARRKRKS
jgi:type I restriction enzyme, S subunit